MQNSLEQLYNQNKYNQLTAKNSQAWFRKEITNIEQYGISADVVLREGGKQTTSIEPGSLYFFYYSPKFKDTLPYYDVFPMVIPYASTPNGFIGLNLHYLPVFARVKLLDALMQFATNPRLDRTTKINYTWALVKTMSKSKLAEPCIHRYIGGYVKSRFVKVEPKDWFSACMLPVQKFRKQSAGAVWKESLS